MKRALDSFALLAFLNGEAGCDRVRELLAEAQETACSTAPTRSSWMERATALSIQDQVVKDQKNNLRKEVKSPDWKGGPKTLFQPFSLAPLRRKSVAPLCRSLTPGAEAAAGH